MCCFSGKQIQKLDEFQNEVESFITIPSTLPTATATVDAAEQSPNEEESLESNETEKRGEEQQNATDWRLLALETLARIHGTPSQVILEMNGRLTLKFD